MVYESDIKYDPKTNRIKECPRCKNEIFSDGAQYCRLCGLELVNKCIPEPWDDSFGYSHDSEAHDNPPDARFCEQCGAPTVYYQKHELLKSSEEALNVNPGDKKQEFDEDIPF